MTAEARILRRLRQAPDLLAEMEKLEAEIRAKVARETDRIARVNAPGKSRKTRREERNERAAKIRAAVMERAGERCEWCERSGFVLEWAHVIDGNGSRTAHEDVTTTAGICADCHHRGWHSGDSVRRAWAYRNAKAWALKHGFKDALAAIEKKIAKVEECGASRAAGGTR